MLQSIGLQRVGYNLATEQQQQRICRNRLVKAREISGETWKLNKKKEEEPDKNTKYRISERKWK